MSLVLIFLTGLTTGGLSCLAVQGGLLASIIANQKEAEHQQSQKNKTAKKNFAPQSFDTLDWLPVVLFLVAKLIAYTILGALLGALGSVISLSEGVRLFFQLFVAVFMAGTALNLLEVHPIFRYLAFQPPRFIQRMVRGTSKSKALFAPALLGLFTIFIPCGVTQAMEVLAIGSGSALRGALIMLVFVLGTSPLFALIGIATAKLSEGWYAQFSKLAAYALLVMALFTFNGVLTVLNSPITFGTLTRPITYFFSEERFAPRDTIQITNGVQQVVIDITDRGYRPNYLSVKQGVPVQLTLRSNNVYSCALSFVFKEFGIKTFMKATDQQTFTFTPTRPGKFTFTCSMGMYSGVLEVR